MGIFMEEQPRENNIIFSELPMLQFCTIKKQVLNMLCPSFCDFIKVCIDAGFYVRVPLNQHYISSYGIANDYVHLFLIYGYDIGKQKCLVADFHSGKRYDFGVIPFDEIELAYINSLGAGSEMYEFYNDIVFIKEKSTYVDADMFDVAKIKSGYSDFINAVDTTRKYEGSQRWRNCSFKYGVEYYDELVNDLRIGQAAVRSFHVLCDYVKKLRYTVEFICNRTGSKDKLASVLQQLQSCESLATVIRNRFTKIRIKDHANSEQTGMLAAKILELKDATIFSVNRVLKILESA
jgi:hypothetical protein